MIKARVGDMRHRDEVHGFTTLVDVVASLYEQTARPQRNESFAVMTNGKAGAKEDVSQGKRQQHNQICRDEPSGIKPAKARLAQHVWLDQRPMQTTGSAIYEDYGKRYLQHGHPPPKHVEPASLVNDKWDKREQAQR